MKKSIINISLFILTFIVGFGGNVWGQENENMIPIEAKLFVNSDCEGICIEHQPLIESKLLEFKSKGTIVNIIFTTWDCDESVDDKNGDYNVYGPSIELSNGETSSLWFKKQSTDFLVIVMNGCTRYFAKRTDSRALKAYLDANKNEILLPNNIKNTCRIQTVLEGIASIKNISIDVDLDVDCSSSNAIKDDDLPKFIDFNGVVSNNFYTTNRKKIQSYFDVPIGGINTYSVTEEMMTSNGFFNKPNVYQLLLQEFGESLVLVNRYNYLKNENNYDIKRIIKSANIRNTGVFYFGYDSNYGQVFSAMNNNGGGFEKGISTISDIYRVSCNGQKDYLKPDLATCGVDFDSEEEGLGYKLVGYVNGQLGSGDMEKPGDIKRGNVFSNIGQIIDIGDDGKVKEDGTPGTQPNFNGNIEGGEIKSGVVDFAGLSPEDLQNAIDAANEFENSKTVYVISSENNDNEKQNSEKTITEIAKNTAKSINTDQEDSPSLVVHIHINNDGSVLVKPYYNKNDDNTFKDIIQDDNVFEDIKQIRDDEVYKLANRPSSDIGMVSPIGNGYSSFPYGVQGESNFFRKYGLFGETISSIWKTGNLQPAFWNDEVYALKINPIAAGVGDGVIEEATGYTMLVKVGFTMLSSKEQCSEIVSNLKFGDVVKGMFPEFNFNGSDPACVLYHDNSKAVVQAVFIFFVPANKGIDILSGVVKKSGVKGAMKKVGKAFIPFEGLSKIKGKLNILSKDYKKKLLSLINFINDRELFDVGDFAESLGERFAKRLDFLPENILAKIEKNFDFVEENGITRFVLKSDNDVIVNVDKAIATLPDPTNSKFYNGFGGNNGFLHSFENMVDDEFVSFLQQVDNAIPILPDGKIPMKQMKEWGEKFASRPDNLDTWKHFNGKYPDDPKIIDADFLTSSSKNFKKYNSLKNELNDPDFFDAYKKCHVDGELDAEKFIKDYPDLAEKIDIKTNGNTKDNSFWKWIVRGRKFEKLIVNELENPKSTIYERIKNDVLKNFEVDLKDYDLYAGIQLKFKGDKYFVADQLFVKWKKIGGEYEIDDIIVLENKLSEGTRLSKRQNGAIKAKGFTVRSLVKEPLGEVTDAGSKKLLSGKEIKVDNKWVNNKWLKVYDEKLGDKISGTDPLKNK